MTRHLAICVATYRREEMLRRLLASLEALSLPGECTAELRLVDNDREGSARELLPAPSGPLGQGLSVSYEVEPEQNIALARNRAIEMGPADLFAFVDDDEVVPEHWLESLLSTLDETDADAVFGPVDGRLPTDRPRWLQHGVFDKETGPEGRPLDWRGTRTSNALVRGEWFTKRGYRFDPSFGRSGSSDTDLFRRMGSAGARYASSAAARVWEEVPAERASLRWLVKRNFRNGLTFQRLRDEGMLVGLARFGYRAFKGAGLALAGLPLVALGRPATAARGLFLFALALGGLRALATPSSAERFVEYGERPTVGGTEDVEEPA